MRTVRYFVYLSLFISLLCRATESSFAGWVKENSPAPGKSLYGVWGSSGGDVIIVGERATLLRYDGNQEPAADCPAQLALVQPHKNEGSVIAIKTI